MHGRREGERRIYRRRHMLPVPPPPPASLSVAASDSAAAVAAITPDSFSKDGRRICVGDCALFKPPQDSPPFIGIIRSLLLEKEESLSLSVNWLYRPADVKLGKGPLLEAAPNELFYSFHKDEIPAVSLLHPCKVAFLRKGVELPSGISSYVCRRVYDIENKCLWWLTDQDYINERQEEVDKLLDKTRLEMHGAVQSGGRSPKGLNGPTATPQLRPVSEGVQNSSSPLPSLVKGKKRDRADQGSDPVKRERSSRADDTDFAPEQLKSEIAKITNKVGLVDLEGVKKLVQLMQPVSTGKKIDLACRIMLVDVIAVTDSFDCLGWFVQLGGLPVLDEWLQEVHKGKIGDGSSPKEGDKVEEFLLVVLRALDKLPVNLYALQTCNVGKSVNHLRSHKNSEIQKKARTLVDTWKKRVETEMNIIDAKSGLNRGGSWSSKSLLSEASHVGSRRNGGSSEASVKNSTVQSSACKVSAVKLGSGETVANIASASSASTKLAASTSLSSGTNAKDPNSLTLVRGGSSDIPLSTIKEEKSSSSSQSQNNSQSCSSDHVKTGGSSCREDARSSTAGSAGTSTISGSASRHQKSSNGLQGSVVSGSQKDTNLGKLSPSSRNLASEKVSPNRGIYERFPDAPLADHVNSRLIVRLPNTGRSPARNPNGGSLEDPSSTVSKVSPSAESEKLDHHDRKVKGKSDALRASNAPNSKLDLCQGRDGLVMSDEGNVSCPDAICNGGSMTDDGEKLMESSKGTVSSSKVIPELGKSYDASFKSINALVESCVKFSEARMTVSGGDDIGMNLLASVAAGEVSRSEVSPSGSPERNSPALVESCSKNDVKPRHLDKDTARSGYLANDGANGGDMLEKGNSVDSLRVKNESVHDATPMSTNISGDVKVTSFGCEEKTGDYDGRLNPSSIDLQQNAYGSYSKGDGGLAQVNDASEAISTEDDAKDRNVESEGANQFPQGRNSDERNPDSRVVVPEVAASEKVEKETNEESPSCLSSELCREDKSALHNESDILTEQKIPILPKIQEESITGKSEASARPSGSVNVLGMESKSETAADIKEVSENEQIENQNIDFSSAILDQTEECCEKSDGKKLLGHSTDKSTSHEVSPTKPIQQTVDCMKSNTGKSDGNEAGGTHECASSVNTSSGSDMVVKLDFDLNEGFPVDDGCQEDLTKSWIPKTLATVHLPCPLPFPVSSMSASFPASITVASAAKGPFFPPENPMRSKGELGWKGSAATSAFRPAEPRKVLEMPLATSCPSVDNTTSMQGRTPLGFDLNVPDQRVLEDLASQNSSRVTCLEFGPVGHRGGGLDLDLNRVDDSTDIRRFSVSNHFKLELPQLSSRSSLCCGFSNAELNASRGFDLNNGPGPDGGVTETTPCVKGNVPFLSPLSGVRLNVMDSGNYSSLFPPCNSYSARAIPSVVPGKGEQSYSVIAATGSQRILGGPSGGSTFGPEFCQGTVLSSSPAIPFPPAAPFQYPGFPFETNFSLSSNSYSVGSTAYVDSSSGGQIRLPAIPSQLVGPSGVVSSHYPRPYVMNLPGGTNNVGPESRKWSSQALDLNTGPGSIEVERRDERLSPALRQLPFPGYQATVDEQIKVFQISGELFKRKEPEGGWEGDRINHKQPSRQ